MNTAVKREKARVNVGDVVGVALQFYKYTDVLTHPDKYTQSCLFQSFRRVLEMKRREKKGVNG